tara:strand:- start:43 stop:204 length:162 start_codon:yes stop_codon:yes gene_type:complete
MRAVHSMVSVDPAGVSYCARHPDFLRFRRPCLSVKEGVEMGSRFQTTLWSMEN